MKKSLTLIFLFIVFGSYSQVNPHAIGLRFNGDGLGNGAEISYQHGFGSANRLELDFGGRSHKHWRHFGVFAGYHWVFNLTDGLNWYVGPGAAIGMYNSRDNYDDGLTLAVGGQIGIEYDFNANGAPILLSLDFRPIWEVWEYYEYYSFGYGGGLSVRYTF